MRRAGRDCEILSMLHNPVNAAPFPRAGGTVAAATMTAAQCIHVFPTPARTTMAIPAMKHEVDDLRVVRHRGGETREYDALVICADAVRRP